MKLEIKQKRIEVLNQLNLLLVKCDCTEPNERAACANCQRIQELSVQLSSLRKNPTGHVAKRIIPWTDEQKVFL